MHTILMPNLGDLIDEGTLLCWLKYEGENVVRGEALAEVETDKCNVEIAAKDSGILRRILIHEGASALVGTCIGYIGTADEPLPDLVPSQHPIKKPYHATHSCANRSLSAPPTLMRYLGMLILSTIFILLMILTLVHLDWPGLAVIGIFIVLLIVALIIVRERIRKTSG